MDYNTATSRKLGNCQTGTNAQRNIGENDAQGIADLGLAVATRMLTGDYLCRVMRERRHPAQMQFEAAKTQAIRSKAAAKRLAHDEIGALDTARVECGRRALGAVREADSFVPELNKVQATNVPARSRTLTRGGCWHSYRKSSAWPDPCPRPVYEKIDSEEDAAERWSFGGPWLFALAKRSMLCCILRMVS
jgi:hypothetical protein